MYLFPRWHLCCFIYSSQIIFNRRIDPLYYIVLIHISISQNTFGKIGICNVFLIIISYCLLVKEIIPIKSFVDRFHIFLGDLLNDGAGYIHTKELFTIITDIYFVLSPMITHGINYFPVYCWNFYDLIHLL